MIFVSPLSSFSPLISCYLCHPCLLCWQGSTGYHLAPLVTLSSRYNKMTRWQVITMWAIRDVYKTYRSWSWRSRAIRFIYISYRSPCYLWLAHPCHPSHLWYLVTCVTFVSYVVKDQQGIILLPLSPCHLVIYHAIEHAMPCHSSGRRRQAIAACTRRWRHTNTMSYNMLYTMLYTMP